MPNPIDVIANAIRVADGNNTAGAGRLAEVAASALTHETIVDNAVQALKEDGWEETHEGPLGIGTLSDDDLRNIALTALRSVGGGD